MKRTDLPEEEFLGRKLATSGAEYLRVRMVSPDVVLFPTSVQSKDMPKSVRKTAFAFTKTFWGLMSLCRTQFS